MTTAERPVTLCEAFQRNASVDPDAVALRTPGSTQTMTWSELAALVRKVTAGLAGLGVGRGDTVSLMMANRIEFYPLRDRRPTPRRHFVFGVQHAARRPADLPVR